MKFTSILVPLALASVALAKPAWFQCGRQDVINFEERTVAEETLRTMTDATENVNRALQHLGGSNGRYDHDSNNERELIDVLSNLIVLQHSAQIGAMAMQREAQRNDKYDQEEQKKVVQHLDRFTEESEEMFELMIKRQQTILRSPFRQNIGQRFEYQGEACQLFFRNLQQVCPDERQQIERQQEKWSRGIKRVIDRYRSGRGGNDRDY